MTAMTRIPLLCLLAGAVFADEPARPIQSLTLQECLVRALAKVQEFKDKFANPYVAADRGFIDDVIEPRHTRRRIIAGLEMTRTKRDKNPPKKHGNIPL